MGRAAKHPRATNAGRAVAQSPGPSRWIEFFIALGLIAATVAAYGPALTGDFIWDDDDYLINNQNLRSAAGLERIWFQPGATRQYYPLVFTTFWIEYHLWGLNTLGYHLVNALLHAGSAILVWRILRRFKLTNGTAALLAGAIFALHPVHVESVAWITERKNILSGFCYLLALSCYLRFERLDESTPTGPRPVRFYLLALALFVCALLSKTVTCSLPAAIALLIWLRRSRLRVRDCLPLVPLFALGAALAGVTIYMEKYSVGATGEVFNLSPTERCLIAGRAIWFYLAKLLWPHPLIFIYPKWQLDTAAAVQYVFPLAALAAIALLWSARKVLGRSPFIAALFFGGTLFPALGFVNVFPMKYSFVADHFQYLASLGPITLFAAAMVKLAGRTSTALSTGTSQKPIVALLFPLVLAPLTVLAWRQAPIYDGVEKLWTETLKRNPASPMVMHNLGASLQKQGRLDEALDLYQRSLEMEPDNPSVLLNRGTILYKKNRLAEGASDFRRALEIRPDYPKALINLAVAETDSGRLDAAAALLHRCLQLEPDYAQAHKNLAGVFLRQGRLLDSMREYQEAVRLAPDDAEARQMLQQVIDRAAAAQSQTGTNP